jgi:formate hydrogenlyase subunit 3/multisubunit Na+/H+ antiporter MnhD subunit
MNSHTPKNITAFGYAFVFAALFNALLVVAKEEIEPLKAWMADISGHHWITHGVVVIVLFIAIGFYAQEKATRARTNERGMARLILVATVLSGVIIAGFYLFFS